VLKQIKQDALRNCWMVSVLRCLRLAMDLSKLLVMDIALQNDNVV